MELRIVHYRYYANRCRLSFEYPGKHEGRQASHHRNQIRCALSDEGKLCWPTAHISKGSSSIVDEKTHQPLLSVVTLIVETAVKLRKDGHRVVIVSSGAIAVGLQRMGIEKKPKNLPRIQVEPWIALSVFRKYAE